MNKITKFLLKETFSSNQYLVTLIITTVLSINGFVSLVGKNANNFNTEFILFYHFMINIVNFVVNIPIILAISVFNEKLSGRCEYYLANNINLNYLIYSYSKSTFLLSCVPILFYNIIVSIYLLTKSLTISISVILNLRYFIFILSLLLFMFVISKYLVVLIMICKKPDNIRTFLTIFSIVSIYAMSFPINYLSKTGLISNNKSILNIYIIFLLIISVIFKVSEKFLIKKLDNEKVILSYRE